MGALGTVAGENYFYRKAAQSHHHRRRSRHTFAEKLKRGIPNICPRKLMMGGGMRSTESFSGTLAGGRITSHPTFTTRVPLN